VTSGKAGTPNWYSAIYAITALSYKPCTLRITDPESPFSEYLGQPFGAQWTHWPFGHEEERRGWITVRLSESLPYADDSDEATEMGKELARAGFPRVGIRVTGRALRFGVAEVQGSRIRPQSAVKTAAKAARRR
jgi:hypothetical protein